MEMRRRQRSVPVEGIFHTGHALGKYHRMIGRRGIAGRCFNTLGAMLRLDGIMIDSAAEWT